MGSDITQSSSGTSYDTDTATSYPAETNTGDLVGPPVLAVTATETDNSTDSTTFSANDITGLEYTSSHAVDSITRPESISLASSDTTGGKFTLTTTDSTESTNAITGSFSLSETTTGSLSNFETDTNSGLLNSNTETGTTSAYSQESGNSILGSFTLSETNYTTTTVVESDAVGAITTSATTTATDFTSASTSGNDITGAESTSGLGQSSATLAKIDSYGSGDADNVTITTNESSLSGGSGNTVTGSFSLSDSSSTTTTTYDSGTRAGNGYSVAASTDIGTVTTSEAGNEITGAVTTTEVAELVRVLAEGGANSAGFPYTLSQQDNSTVTTTSSENTITGDSMQTVYSAETTSIGQYDYSSGGGTATPVNLSYTELIFSGSTASETANTITGVYGSTTNELDTSTFTETGSNAAGTISVSSTTSQSPQISESGNTISGDYTFSENGTQDYTTSETDDYGGSGSGGTESWSFLETGSKGFSLTQSGSHVTGAYTLFESGADHYTISETGGSSGGGSAGGTAWGLTLTGLDNYTTNERGNELSGAFSRTASGSGSGTLDEGGSLGSTSYNATPSTHFLVTETGNYLSGALSFAESGTDRYSLIEGFTNVSNVVPTNGPGAIDFTPVGAPYHVGANPYWGHGPAANLDANAADAAFNEMGLDLLHEYCFAAGTPVPVRGGIKFVENLVEGDEVASRPEGDPHAPTQYRRVVKLYRNDPAPIFEVRAGHLAIRTTFGHWFYETDDGWTHAGELRPGSKLLGMNSDAVVVSRVIDAGFVAPVYNIQVEEFHTFFVGDETSSVLVHNASVRDARKNPLTPGRLLKGVGYYYHLGGIYVEGVKGMVGGQEEQGRKLGSASQADLTDRTEQSRIRQNQIVKGEKDGQYRAGSAIAPIDQSQKDLLTTTVETGLNAEAGSAGMASAGSSGAFFRKGGGDGGVRPRGAGGPDGPPAGGGGGPHGGGLPDSSPGAGPHGGNVPDSRSAGGGTTHSHNGNGGHPDLQPSDAGDSAGHRQSSGRNTGGSATTEKPDSESPTSSTGSNAKSNELGPTDGRETPARQRNSNRREYMGQNPNKNSTTYRDVVARMREEGKIVGEGEKAMVKIPDGTWIPLKDAELAHTEDAMIYWNREGKYWGPKHPKVREFMTDPDNYVFDKPGSNRSAGARLKDVGYDPPDPRPGGPLSGAGAP